MSENAVSSNVTKTLLLRANAAMGHVPANRSGKQPVTGIRRAPQSRVETSRRTTAVAPQTQPKKFGTLAEMVTAQRAGATPPATPPKLTAAPQVLTESTAKKSLMRALCGLSRR